MKSHIGGYYIFIDTVRFVSLSWLCDYRGNYLKWFILEYKSWVGNDSLHSKSPSVSSIMDGKSNKKINKHKFDGYFNCTKFILLLYKHIGVARGGQGTHAPNPEQN